MAVKVPTLYDFTLRLIRARGLEPKRVPAPHLDFSQGAKVVRAWRAICPSCGNRSLSLLLLSDGDAYIVCHSRYCRRDRMYAAIGLPIAGTGYQPVFVPTDAHVRAATVALARVYAAAYQRRQRTRARGRREVCHEH